MRYVCVVFFLEVVLYGLLNFWNCKFRSFVKLELLSVSISSGILPLVCFYFLDMRILKRWVFYYRILRLILSSFSFWCLTLVSLYSSKSKLTVSLLTFTIFVTNRICFFFLPLWLRLTIIPFSLTVGEMVMRGTSNYLIIPILLFLYFRCLLSFDLELFCFS